MYEVILFGETPIPQGIARGHVQNMGTGNALSSYLPLPGGGWYNNYRGRKAPQGIRPITKQGRLHGTAAAMEAYLDSWRALLGEEKKLTIRYYTGRLRWQWATLLNVDAPTKSEMKGGWADYTLSWISAAQNWRGVVFPETSWTWGDGTWLWGDGTAEMGVDRQSFSLTSSSQAVTVVHDGSIDAPNVTLRLNISGTWQDVTIVNETTGQQIVINRASSDTIPQLEIDAGTGSIYAMGTPKYAAVSRSINTVNVTTSAVHGLATDDTVRIEDSNEYNGDYYPATVGSTVAFSVPISPRSSAYGSNTGYIRELTDLYSVTTFSDIERWMVMAPGDNTLRITWSPEPDSATLIAEFVDHYG